MSITNMYDGGRLFAGPVGCCHLFAEDFGTASSRHLQIECSPYTVVALYSYGLSSYGLLWF